KAASFVRRLRRLFWRDDPGRLLGRPPPAAGSGSRVHGPYPYMGPKGPSSTFSGSRIVTNDGSASESHSAKPSTWHQAATSSEMTVPCASTTSDLFASPPRRTPSVQRAGSDHLATAASTAASNRVLASSPLSFP